MTEPREGGRIQLIKDSVSLYLLVCEKNTYIEIAYEKLAHIIMENEKSHDLMSASWRPRKAHGIIQSKELRTRGAGDVNSSWRAGEDMFQLNQ